MTKNITYPKGCHALRLRLSLEKKYRQPVSLFHIAGDMGVKDMDYIAIRQRGSMTWTLWQFFDDHRRFVTRTQHRHVLHALAGMEI